MATTVEQHPAQTLNGAEHGREGIPVENPATGEIVATVPDLGADAVAEMARMHGPRSRPGRSSASRGEAGSCCVRRSG